MDQRTDGVVQSRRDIREGGLMYGLRMRDNVVLDSR